MARGVFPGFTGREDGLCTASGHSRPRRNPAAMQRCRETAGIAETSAQPLYLGAQPFGEFSTPNCLIRKDNPQRRTLKLLCRRAITQFSIETDFDQFYLTAVWRRRAHSLPSSSYEFRRVRSSNSVACDAPGDRVQCPTEPFSCKDRILS